MSDKKIKAVDIELSALRDGVDAAVRLADEHRPAPAVVEKAAAFLERVGVDATELNEFAKALRRRGPRLTSTDITLSVLRDGMDAALALVHERRPPHSTVEAAADFLEEKGRDATPLRERRAPQSSEELPTLNLEELKRLALMQAIALHPGNYSAAIRELGCGRTTFYRHLKKHGLSDFVG